MRICTLAAAFAAVLASAPAGAADFAYRGQLSDRDRPAQGRYDLQVTVYSGERGGAPLSPPMVLPGVNVRDGRFAAPIQLDDALLAGGARWLEIAVRESGSTSAFDTLPVREKAVLAPESFCAGTWSTTGNAGNPAGSYLGTSDLKPLELRVANQPVAKFVPITGQTDLFAINLGVSGNQATGDGSTTIGGYLDTALTASGFASIAAGGYSNVASGYAGTVIGGGENTASGQYAAVFGGYANLAGGDDSLALGTQARVRDKAQAGESGCENSYTCGDEGTFIWSDESGANFESTGPNQFLVRAAGGVGINTNAPTAGTLTVAGDVLLTRTAARQVSVGKEPDNSTSGKQLTLRAGDASDSGVPFQARPGGDLVLQAGNGYNVNVAGQDGGDVIIRSGADWISANTLADAGGDIVLQTGGQANAFTERMRIKDTGEVSIGTLGAAGATTLCRNASNQIATCSSSARYKDHVVDADYGLDTVEALRPVRYEWKETHAPDLGLVAEEVAAVEPDLATRNDAGEIEGVKYDRLAAVLVKAMQEQQAQIRQQQAEIAALRAEQRLWLQRLEQMGVGVAGVAAGVAQ